MKAKNKGQGPHRTATTAYPCYLPILGDSAGAGREDLPGCKGSNTISKEKILFVAKFTKATPIIFFLYF